MTSSETSPAERLPLALWLSTYSLHPDRRSAQCDFCGRVLDSRRELFHKRGRLESCGDWACLCELVEGRFVNGTQRRQVMVTRCAEFPSDAGEHVVKPDPDEETFYCLVDPDGVTP